MRKDEIAFSKQMENYLINQVFTPFVAGFCIGIAADKIDTYTLLDRRVFMNDFHQSLKTGLIDVTAVGASASISAQFTNNGLVAIVSGAAGAITGIMASRADYAHRLYDTMSK